MGIGLDPNEYRLDDGIRTKENFVLKRSPFLIFLPILFLVVGAAVGFAIWQMSQSQAQQRSLSSTKTLLEQTNQQAKYLKQENEAALKLRAKLQADLQNSQKQLGDLRKQTAIFQQQLKASQDQISLLSAENGKLRSQVVAAQQQMSTLNKLKSGTPVPKIETPVNDNGNFIPPR